MVYLVFRLLCAITARPQPRSSCHHKYSQYFTVARIFAKNLSHYGQILFRFITNKRSPTAISLAITAQPSRTKKKGGAIQLAPPPTNCRQLFLSLLGTIGSLILAFRHIIQLASYQCLTQRSQPVGKYYTVNMIIFVLHGTGWPSFKLFLMQCEVFIVITYLYLLRTINIFMQTGQ